MPDAATVGPSTQPTKSTLGSGSSAGDMENGVHLARVKLRDQATSLLRRHGVQIHAPTFSLRDDLRSDRQRAVGPGADDQPAPAPRQLLRRRQRGVPEFSAVRLRGTFFRLRTFPPSMTTSYSKSSPPTLMDPNRTSRTFIAVASRTPTACNPAPRALLNAFLPADRSVQSAPTAVRSAVPTRQLADLQARRWRTSKDLALLSIAYLFCGFLRICLARVRCAGVRRCGG